MTRNLLRTIIIFLLLCANSVQAKEIRQSSYLELGVTASTLIHPSIGYWWGPFGIRFTGMYLHEDHHEYHMNFGFALSESKDVQHSINLLTSRVVASDPGADYRYAATGIAYGLNYKGFFLEIGLARPWRDDIGNLASDSFVPCGYWGYIYRFKS